MLWALGWGGFCGIGQAAIQFDMFPGYDRVVRGGGWYPVGFEVMNDGPGFEGVIELVPNQMGAQPIRIPLDLPTNTRKRLVVPQYSTSSGFITLDARLLDGSGKVRAELKGEQVRPVAWEGFLMGALPETFSGMPAFPVFDAQKDRQGYRPGAVRMMTEFFPDNPLALEGLNALYLSSRRALELKEPQVEALLTWVHLGGHLVVSVDQPGDVQATEWLRDLLPASVQGVRVVAGQGEWHRWVRDGEGPGWGDLRYGMEPARMGAEDRRSGTRMTGTWPTQSLAMIAEVDRAEMPVAGLRPKVGARVLVTGAEDVPLLVAWSRGRGLVTLTAVHPEREPLRGWVHRGWWWARVAGVPMELLQPEDPSVWGGRGVDAVFGSMTETRQIRKLPMEMLILLLTVYLVVIGPWDQWVLKKLRRPMLTWVTFPAYVALFSLLIYYIGFRLRAGATEWNELHVVDVHARRFDAVLRGRSFTSLYSPGNATYPLASELTHVQLRSDVAGIWGGGGGADRGRLRVELGARGLVAETFVPVWSSQFHVADWVEVADAPLRVRVEGSRVRLENPGSRPMEPVAVIHRGRLHRVDTLAPGGRVEVDLARSAGWPSVLESIQEWYAVFQSVSQRRDDLFGDSESSRIDDWAEASMAVSVLGLVPNLSGNTRQFVWPAGLDLSPVVERTDQVLVLAWLPDRLLVPGLNRFTAERSRQATLVRMVVPLDGMAGGSVGAGAE